jgi:hypothetical protein
MKKPNGLPAVAGIFISLIVIGALSQRRGSSAVRADVDLLIAGGAIVTMDSDRRGARAASGERDRLARSRQTGRPDSRRSESASHDAEV